jgi:hypothetical protein
MHVDAAILTNVITYIDPTTQSNLTVDETKKTYMSNQSRLFVSNACSF